MRRVMFVWRGITVYSYPAMLYVGLCFGTLAGNAAAHSSGIDALSVFIATVVLVPLALIGARLLYVAINWRMYRDNLARIWDTSDGGQAQYGGLPLVLPLSVPLLSALDLHYGAFWDVGVITILVGMIFTRFGCLMNGCCAGAEYSGWGSLYLPNRLGVWKNRVPTQLMEAALATVILITGLMVWPYLPFRGGLLLYVLSSYGAGRLVLESLRESHGPLKRGFTVHHGISIVLIAVSAAALLTRGNT